MMKTYNSFPGVLFLISLIITSCGTAPIPEEQASSEQDTAVEQPDTPETTSSDAPKEISPLEREYTSPPENTTRIVIDGEATDWLPYPAIITDPTGDSQGNVDISYSYAFTNQEYLYILFEAEGSIGSYVQLDIDINSPAGGGIPEYMLNARPYQSNTPNLQRIQNGEFTELGQVGSVSQNKAIELKIPLNTFDGPAPERVSLRIMDGVCCGEEWRASEEVQAFSILSTDEKEIQFENLADLTSEDSAFCRKSSLVPSSALQTITGIQVPAGYSVSYLIPPSGLNVPSDVVVMSNGDIMVTSSRMEAIHKVNQDGTLSLFSKAHTYALDRDDQGNLYGYMFPSGDIFKVSPEGAHSQILRMQDTACESTLASAGDGTLYIGTNFCSGETTGVTAVYRIQPGRNALEEIAGGITESISSLDVDANGTLYAVFGNALQKIDVENGERTTIAELPDSGTFHGLVVDDKGTAYVATGDMGKRGDLYSVDQQGVSKLVASFEDDSLQGLALTSDGKIVGTQRSISGLKIIDQNGKVQDLVKPNGLVSPHTIAVSPCGELIAVNDEAGRLTIASPAGENSSLVNMNSFQPPQAFLAFAPEGWYVTGESAPGFPSFLKRYLPNGLSEIVADDISEVSGVAVGSDGTIYASATQAGQIIKINEDKTQEVLADGLVLPQALALAGDGTLYVAVGGAGDSDVFSMPQFGSTLMSVSSEGTVTKMADINAAADIALASDNSIFVASKDIIYKVTPPNTVEIFAQGFKWIRGVAFDAAGNLLASDDTANAIYRISGFPTGNLTGSVLDDNNAGIGTVYVRATQSNPPFAGRLTATGDDGAFTLDLTPGTYTLTVWKDGYQVSNVENVVIKEGKETSQQIILASQ
jgi:hypothetical protein